MIQEQQPFRTSDIWQGLGDLWCSWMHSSPRWPIHGHYECGVCGRQYLVPWNSEPQQ